MAQTAPQAVMLISVIKPLVVMASLWAWAYTATWLDRELESIDRAWRFWRQLLLGACVVGFGLWLTIPAFWIGTIVALIILGTPLGGCAYDLRKKRPTPKRINPLRDSRAKRSAQRSLYPTWAKHRVPVSFQTQVLSPTAYSETRDLVEIANRTFEELLGYALAHRAQSIAIEASSQSALVSIQIDGVCYPQPPLEPAAGVNLIDYLKLAAELKVTERRCKQTAKVSVHTGPAGLHTLVVTTFGSIRGLSLTLDIDPQLQRRRPIDQLGLLEDQQKLLGSILDQPNRVVLIATPPGHGQTTMLYSILQEQDPYLRSSITLEDQIAFEIEGVDHRRLEPGLTPDQLRERLIATLRQDPQVLMISGLVGGGPAVRLIAESAEDVRYYIGVRQEDTFAALRHWVSLVGQPKAAAESLSAIIACRLVRKLCIRCRLPYEPNPGLIRKLNLSIDQDQVFYKHSGQLEKGTRYVPCPDCLGLGYRDQVGVYEIMALDDEARGLIANEQLDPLQVHLRKQKMVWLYEAAIANIALGITSISETTRVLGQEPGHFDGQAWPAQPALNQYHSQAE